MRRIVVVGGPWPERVGAIGWLVEPTLARAAIYPFRGLGKDEVVIRLDHDPLLRDEIMDQRWWTCAIRRSSVEPLLELGWSEP